MTDKTSFGMTFLCETSVFISKLYGYIFFHFQQWESKLIAMSRRRTGKYPMLQPDHLNDRGQISLLLFSIEIQRERLKMHRKMRE